MECFYEQFQTKDYTQIEKSLNIASKVSLVLLALFLVTVNITMTIIFIIIYALVFIMSRNLIVEYEYELTGDDLSIYKIMNKSKRKEIGHFSIRDISKVKTIESTNNNNKIIKAYLEESEHKAMVYMAKTSKGVMGFQLAMDEKLLNIIKRVNPLAFY